MEENKTTEISARITYWREKAGLRQIDLAKSLDMSAGTISKWESGQIDPPVSVMLRIASACDVTPRKFWSSIKR